VNRADIPSGLQRIALPASMKPEVAGEFDLDARALLAPGLDDGDQPRAVLLNYFDLKKGWS